MKNTAVRTGKNKIYQNEFIMRVYRTENEDNIRNIFSNKIVPQYYLNKNICGDADSISF